MRKDLEECVDKYVVSTFGHKKILLRLKALCQRMKRFCI